MERKDFSVVVPAYNESKNISLILDRFKEVKGNINLEVVLVNNGSTDNSKEIIGSKLKKNDYSFVKVISIPKNIGYGHGIMQGLINCNGKIIGYTHGDMQCDPYDAIKAYKIISKTSNQKKCLVRGWRRKRKLIPGILAYCYQTIATIIFMKKFKEINAQPKIFHKDFLDKLVSPPLDTNLDFYILYTAKKEKMNIINFKVNFPDRKHGKSKVFFSFNSKVKTISNFFKYLILLRFLKEKK